MESDPIDQCELHSAEEQIIQRFVRDGCKCDHGPNCGSCSASIAVDHFRSVRRQITEMTHDKLEWLSWVERWWAASGRRPSGSRREVGPSPSSTTKAQGSARRIPSSYSTLWASYTCLKSIKNSFVANGVVVRVYGNKGKSCRKDKLALKQIQMLSSLSWTMLVCTSLSRCLC